jgi:hypothetical protein
MEEISAFESDQYPVYSLSLNHNGTITSNRVIKVQGNVINKGGMIADNFVAAISNNTSATILSNACGDPGRGQGSILYNYLEYVIYNNNTESGIVSNQGFSIYDNTCSYIANNSVKNIIGNVINTTYYGNGAYNGGGELSRPAYIANNKSKGDILSNSSGAIINNNMIWSIWNNNINGTIEDNTAYEIKNNY